MRKRTWLLGLILFCVVSSGSIFRGSLCLRASQDEPQPGQLQLPPRSLPAPDQPKLRLPAQGATPIGGQAPLKLDPIPNLEAVPSKLPVAAQPEFRLPTPAILKANASQAEKPGRAPSALAPNRFPEDGALLEHLHGSLDIYTTASELEKGKPWRSNVSLLGIQELGGKRFLVLKRSDEPGETWFLDASQIVAIRQR